MSTPHIPVCNCCLGSRARCVCPYFHVKLLRITDLWWRPQIDHGRPNPFEGRAA